MRAVRVACFVAAAVAAVSCGLVAGNIVTITQCPKDAATCAGTSCHSFEVPEAQCQLVTNSSIRSQSFTCIPFAGICANIRNFASGTCSGSIAGNNDLVCGKCYPQNGGQSYMRPDCLYTNQGTPYMAMNQCKDPQCQDCVAAGTIKTGQCFADTNRGVNGSSYLAGFEVCSLLSVAQYTTPDCSGTALADFLPARQCMEGTIVSCRDN